MVGGLLNKLASKSLKVAGKWQQQQLRRLNIHEYQLLLDTSGPYNAISMVHLVEICHNFDSFGGEEPNPCWWKGLGKFTSGLQGGVHIVKAVVKHLIIYSLILFKFQIAAEQVVKKKSYIVLCMLQFHI
ncbi:putative succinate--CoA ligase (ADP-forming) [Helianthus anomalus]